MHLLRSIMLILKTCVWALYLPAQSVMLEVEGVVRDATAQQGLELATVTALDSSGQFINGTTTDHEGHYSLALPFGQYQVSFAFVGYRTLMKEVHIKKENVNLSAALEPYGIELAEVAVIGERSTIERRIDRQVIHLGKDLQAVGDATGVLEQIAEVQVDPNGQVQLRGSSQVVILVNGKPSPLSNSDLLQQLSASEISKIELITTPSVKFQADGLSGMINIITRQRTQKGWQANLNTSASSNERYQASLRLAYGTPSFGLYAQGSWSDRMNPSRRSRSRIASELDYQELGQSHFSGGVDKLDVGADYLLGSRHQFSAQWQIVDNQHDIIAQSHIKDESTSGNTDFSFTAHNRHQHLSSEHSINYRYSWPKAERFLEVEWHRSNNTNDLWAQYQTGALLNTQMLDYRNRIDNIALDYTHPFSNESTRLETGMLLTLKQAQNQPSGQTFEGDELSQLFSFDETILGMYSLLHKSWDKWQIQAGLRYELYRSEASFLQNAQNDFRNFFPSLHLSYDPQEKWRLTLAYNRRTSRPNLWNLNPFSNPNNRYFLHQGNPMLRPEFSHNLELSGQINGEKINLYPTLFIRHKTELINLVYELQEAQTIQTFVNDGQSLAYGLELSTQWQATESWKLHASANAYRERLFNTSFLSGRQTTYSANLRLRSEWKPSSRWAVDLSWQYNAPGQRRFNTYADRQKIDLATRYNFWQDRARLGFRLTDIFDTYRFLTYLNTENFRESYRMKGETRVAYLTFTYHFRKGAKGPKRQRKTRNFKEAGTLE